MSPPVLYLRAEAVLRARLDDDQEIETALIPHRVTYQEGSHTKAKEVSVEIHGSALPFPLEHVASVFCSVFLGVVDTVDGSIQRPDNLRFVGYIDEEDVDEDERSVSFKARDLSQLLREHELGPRVVRGQRVDPTPRYSDTLEQAIQRILSVVPSFDDPAKPPPLRVRPTEALPTAPLGTLVEGRCRKGPIALPPKVSAWAAIEHVCGLAVRFVGVELGEIVVRLPSDAFASKAEPKYTFIVGTEEANAFGPRRRKQFIRNRKGIKVVGWNLETRKRVEAVFPPDDELRTKIPRKQATPNGHHRSRHARPAQPPPEPERDVVTVGPGLFTEAQLRAYAERLWLERGRHEVEGTISTPIWDDKVLALHNGDRIEIKVRPDLQAEIQQTTSDDDAAGMLVARLGVSREAARILVRLVRRPHDDLWYVKTVTHDWPSQKATTVGFLNLLRV
jgi:hypothetical protein